MKNKTIIIIFLVIVAIAITIFFVNQKKLNDTKIPSSVTTTPLITPVAEKEIQTEVVPLETKTPTNPSLPPAGYEPR